MQPIGNVWSKFPRVVRDLALGCGKQVHIEMEGKETELDKTIIEAIKDPLTHLVRNAVDHGIESPEVRKQAGKNPEGRLFLRAFHEGGQVNIEISDDGAGLDLNKIRNKAVQKGLISSDQALRMGDREVANLIFLAGLSTAEKVTNVSGRGVGMDVVKTNIEKIGGTVDVQSKPGQGSTVRVKIPLTLAIIPALMVTSGGDRYAIPQVSLLELVRIDGENTRKSIELIHGSPVYRLRGRLLPLVYLNRELNVGRSAERDRSPGGGASGQTAIDLAEVRSEHELWIGRLRQVLDGKFSLSLDQAGSSRDCALGKWLDSCGLKSYGDIEEMRILEETHRRFHEAAREVVACQERADVAGESEFARAKRLSTQIIDLLAVVEKKIAETQSVNIVVLQAEDRQFGLVVDAISDTEEIVVKPLRKHIKGINAYAGATILGDGRVALILDVLGLAQRANVVRESRDAAVAEKEGTPASAIGERSGHTVLLFQNGERERMAIELSQVARLEEFSREAIEIVGGREVVQYRGQIMPLLHLSQFFGALGSAESDSLRPVQVVVYSEGGHTVGLIVDRILDIIEDAFQIQPDTGRSGVLGSAVIQKRTTEILDIRSLVASVAQS
jgi:chemotaxis protein histidine kinase CheA